jgi:predicted HD phosphohydrolase
MNTTPSPASMAKPLAPDQAQRLLRALAEPIRLQVVQALAGGERCVCDHTGAATQVRKASRCSSSWSRGGASKCRRSRPMAPESTCIGASGE